MKEIKTFQEREEELVAEGKKKGYITYEELANELNKQTFTKEMLNEDSYYIQADFVIRKGKMHHKRRYKNVINLSAYFYGENINDAEQETARDLLVANAENYDGVVNSVLFYKSVEELEGVTL